MKKLVVLPLCLGACLAACQLHAMDLKQSKLTQVVNDVQIISAADQKEKPATVNEIFSMPDILRTGAASRAELMAPDQTVTRVGANTIFSFDPANRTIDLKQGSLLFHAPHGKGGGTIHTGSATASVLGTTLIIVATLNGGFKVIDLEGEVEVKFLNGLKQKLNPGQMTFVLPGANQLAPVIIFRLDELTLNSLLVKGFSQPLDSMPLIQNQVDKQLKLIASGKVSDTGLYAGDDASPNSVEVLDLNTLAGHNEMKPAAPPQSPPPPPPPAPSLSAAEAADALLIQSSLTDVTVPTPPVHVFTGTPFYLTGNSFFNRQTFSGFVARNLVINTPRVDVSPYSSQHEFDFVAVNDLSLQSSVTFGGLSAQSILGLIAGGQLNLAPDITVQANVNNFLLASSKAMNFDSATLLNNVGDLTLNSGDAVTFRNGSMLNAHRNLDVSAANDISATGNLPESPGSGSSLGPIFHSANAEFTSLTGTISFNNAMLIASGSVIFNGSTEINFANSVLDASDLTVNGTGSASVSLNSTAVNAPGSITLLAANDLNVNTSVLASDATAGTVQMQSLSGTVNVSSTPITAQTLTLRAANDLNVNNSALISDAASGAVRLESVSGSVNVSGAPVTAQTLTVSAGDSINFDEGETVGGGEYRPLHAAAPPTRYLKLNSGDGILLSSRGRILTPGETSSSAAFTAPNVINVNNSDLTSFATVNMAANTINLSDVAFGSGSSVTLRSQNGELAPNPNTGAASVPGDVNFIRNVLYGGSPAQYYVGEGITVTTLH